MIDNSSCHRQFRLLVLTGAAVESIHHGIGLRAHHLLRRLPDSYEISYLSADRFTSPNAPYMSRLHRFGSRFRVQRPYRLDPKFQQAIDCELGSHSYDAVLVMGVDLLHYTERCDVPVIADLVDEPILAALREIRAHGISVKALRMAKHVLELLPYLRRVCRKASRCILVSEEDARSLRRIVPGVSLSVLANGVDTEFFHPAGLPVKSNEIVFAGIMGFPPNIAAAQYFAHYVFPRIREAVPKCRWSIVGGGPSPEIQALAGPDICVTGWVPDIRPYLEQAAIIVSPLISGGGMKNKILEAWAMGKAVIATPLGCAGVDAHDGVNLLIARNAREFAARAVYLLTHPEEAEKLGRSAQRTVAVQYRWEEKSAQLDHILRDVLAKSGKRT